MRFISIFLFTFLFIVSAKADIISEVLEEFAINNTKANRDSVINIQKSITQDDIRDFKSTLKSKPNNAYIVKREIEKIDAPKFLMFLAMTESRFTNFATSDKKAAGMWQFMPKTAKAFGLDINAHVDERRDPFLSTDTAFAYIATLNGMFDNKWYLSLMAYNCGDGCMRKTIKNLGTNDFSALLNSSITPKETKGFIKKIIKYTIISKTPHIESVLVNLEPNVEIEKIKVDGGTKLSSVAKSIGVPVEDMKTYNPHIKQGVAPSTNETYHFYIPEDKLNLYALNYIGKLIRGEKELDKRFEIHRVAKDETLKDIADKWSVKVADIKELNGLKSDKVVVGYELKIPLTNLALNDNKKYSIGSASKTKKFDFRKGNIVALSDL
ncbi:lytic transglycosylase domain-containing protein, partial [Campylobacter corcagiensis]|uniref:Transglycosylase SLT domain-containing protein n=1 Tax=Campylobacter corcagiensis TaxID=1448857 RepID=A0A7M1LFH3_9BACT